MYYRYKVKSKDHRFLKFCVTLILIGAAVYGVYSNKQYLMFWKYSENRLNAKIAAAASIPDREQRVKALGELCSQFDLYKSNDPMSSEVMLLSGRLRSLLGSAHLPGSFSELVINGKLSHVNEAARIEFLTAIKDIRKGLALLNGREADQHSLFALSRALFYVNYYPVEEIKKITDAVADMAAVKDPEDLRFHAVLTILAGNPDAGVNILLARPEIQSTIEGGLFHASAESMAGRYTNAIMIYRDIQSRVTDSAVHRLIHVRLGGIYFKQSLYNESIESYTAALTIDESDNTARLSIGRNYQAMGQKDKARAVILDVLSRDKANAEAMALLDVM